MSDKVISRDPTGLELVRDDRDPPRYYLKLRGRRDLIAIGNAGLALRQFTQQAQRLRRIGLRARTLARLPRTAVSTGRTPAAGGAQARAAAPSTHSHSMVAGGLEEMS